MTKLIERAEMFATGAHAAIGHMRKYTGEHYIVHPYAVARLVSQVTGDEEMLAAAWLHDVVEDTKVPLAVIGKHFGARVMLLVNDLTDVSKPSDGNRKARKLLDFDHTAAAAPDAKTIKLADMIDNTKSIIVHAPGFAETYMAEKKRLLTVLKEGDSVLYEVATKIVEAYYKK